MDSSKFISVSNLTKTYSFGRVRALDGINLDIAAGEVFGLVGPNGAGKTTLMGCLLGLLWPTNGAISVDGKSPNDLSVKRMTGFMPERPSFDKWMNISQFLTYQYMLTGQPLSNRRATITEALETVKLERSAWRRPVRKLSRGMLQRLGLAQILITKPRLCFLDEPTSGMDPIGMALVRDLLLRWKASGATVVLNSHHLHEVERVCDRVAFIQRGKIQSIETLKELQAGALFSIRWGAAITSIDEESILDELTKTLQVKLEEKEPGCAKLVLQNAADSADVIKFLVNKGIPVFEAAFERKALLDLFVESESNR